MTRRIIVLNADGTPVHEGDVVPEHVKEAQLKAKERRLTLVEALGPTPEQVEQRKRKFAEFLAAKQAEKE